MPTVSQFRGRENVVAALHALYARPFYFRPAPAPVAVTFGPLPKNASSTFDALGIRPDMAPTTCLDCQRCSAELMNGLAESRASKSAAALVDKRSRWHRRVCAGPCPAAPEGRSLVARTLC